MPPPTAAYPVPSNNLLLHQSFKDVEHLIETTADWELDFLQLEPGKFYGEVFQAITPTWQIGQIKCSRRLKQHGLPPAHLYNIVIPGTSDFRLQWRGHQVTESSIMVTPLGDEFESISDSSFNCFIVGITQEQLVHISEALELPELNTLVQGAEVVDCVPSVMARLRCKLHYLTRRLAMNPELLHYKSMVDEIETELPQHILQALTHGKHNSPISIPRRKDYTLKAAEAYIHAHAHRGITIHQMCEELNISARTLRAAFCDRYGISPKIYLKRYQLAQVHRQLYATKPHFKTVSEIAKGWGFGHMGKFTQDYQAMFGERPSATLKQVRAPAHGSK